MRKVIIGLMTVVLLASMLGAAPVSATPVASPSGLVSWWSGDGNAKDIWDGNDGTLMGGMGFGAGKVGLAFSFDGIDDYVSVPDAGSLKPSAITVDAWFYATAISGQKYPPIVKKAGGGASTQEYGYALEINQYDSMIRFWVYLSGDWNPWWLGWVSTPGYTVSTGRWYHVAGTYDGSTIKLYIDGTLVGSTGMAETIAHSSNPLNIGGDPANPDRFFNGLIDEVEIYNRALIESEISAIYSAGSDGKYRPVSVDIKPGSYPNSINLGDQGVIPVVAFGSATFDVMDIDPNTIELGGVAVTTRGKAAKVAVSCEYVNSDPYLDLVAFFRVQDLVSVAALTSSTTSLMLTARLNDGTWISGTDSVNIVPP